MREAPGGRAIFRSLPVTICSGKRLVVAVLVVTAIVVAPGRSGAGAAALQRTASAANLWVDADGGSCVRRARPSSYRDAEACRSLQAASNAATAGDLIFIRDGRYPGQQLTGSKRITLQGVGPGRSSFGQIITSASNITLRHVLIENRNPPVGAPVCSYFDFTLFACGANETYDDVIVDGLRKGSGDPERRGGLQVEAASTNLVFKNGEIRGVRDAKGFQGGADGIVIDNNHWHDIALTPAGGAAGVHNECAYITGGNNQKWRRNRFILCPVMAMFFANYLGGPPFGGVLVENNLFTHTLNSAGSWHDGAAFVIPHGAGGQNQVNNWIVRYNTFETPPSFGSTPGTGDDNGSALFYGNLGADGDCGVSEWTYRYNVGETCRGVGEIAVRGSTNSARRPDQAPFFVDAPNGDFRLRPRSAAIGRGDPSRFPPRDADGSNRPLGRADAGAYEYGTGVLAVGGLDSDPRFVGAAMRRFNRSNAADLLVTSGDNDLTRGRAFSVTWKRTFGWLRSAGIDVAGALGDRDVRVRGGRYQFGALGMPAPYYVRRTRDAEIVVLNSSAVTPTQTSWLRTTLARPTRVRRIVVAHHSPLSCNGSQASAAVRSQWMPLFERYRVALVLSGDEGNYQRLTRRRVTYVVAGRGVAVTGRCRPAASGRRRAASAARAFVYLVADRAGITVTAVAATGARIDRVRLR